MIVKALYSVLRFVATWLQQPTVIQVADSIDVHAEQSRPA
jgi:hypothetical protein